MSSTRPEELLRRSTRSEDETLALGRALGLLLEPGMGLALSGELGAGKTVFVRGLAQGLEVDQPEEVRSPSYLLMIEHPGPKPLLHLDAYFAQRSQSLLDDGGEAYLRDGFVTAVEWAERLAMPIPEGFLHVHIAHRGEVERELVISGDAAVWAALLGDL